MKLAQIINNILFRERNGEICKPRTLQGGGSVCDLLSKQ